MDLQDALANVCRFKYPDRVLEIEQEIESRERNQEHEVLEAKSFYLSMGSEMELRSEGSRLGTIDTSMRNGRVAMLKLSNTEYTMRRRGLIKGPFVLIRDGEVLAEGMKASVFSSRIKINYSGFVGELVPELRNIVLRFCEENLGAIGPSFGDPTSVTLETFVKLPLELRAFIVWLYILSYRQSEFLESDTFPY